MLIWIFDLDHTLYSMDQPFLYSKLKRDKYLDFMLSMLPGRKIIFTNATKEHAIKCLNIIGIKKHFEGIEARDTLDGLKPQPHVYQKLIDKYNIKKSDLCIFFEDTMENLFVAKSCFGWKTIFIGYSDSKIRLVDLRFEHIHETLEYLVKSMLTHSKP